MFNAHSAGTVTSGPLSTSQRLAACVDWRSNGRVRSQRSAGADGEIATVGTARLHRVAVETLHASERPCGSVSVQSLGYR